MGNYSVAQGHTVKHNTSIFDVRIRGENEDTGVGGLSKISQVHELFRFVKMYHFLENGFNPR